MLSKKCILLLVTMLALQEAQAQNIAFRYQVDRMAIFHKDSQVCDYQFTELCAFSEGLSWAAQGELYGYVDSFGKEVIPFIYHDVRSFSHDVAVVSGDSGAHFGLINKVGTPIGTANYTEFLEVKHGLVAVKGLHYWGLLNTNGTLLLDTIYEHPPTVISSNFIVAYSNHKVGIVNAMGKTLHPFRYDYISRYGEAYIGKKKYWLNLR
jgi:hypothetical protein